MRSVAGSATRSTYSASIHLSRGFLRKEGRSQSFERSPLTLEKETGGYRLVLPASIFTCLAASTKRLIGSMPSSLTKARRLCRAPALGIGFARDLGVRYR